MYNPCLECYRKYGRAYRATCDQICDYAACCKERSALIIERRKVNILLTQLAELIDENGRLLNQLFGKGEATDGN